MQNAPKDYEIEASLLGVKKINSKNKTKDLIKKIGEKMKQKLNKILLLHKTQQ